MAYIFKNLSISPAVNLSGSPLVSGCRVAANSWMTDRRLRCVEREALSRQTPPWQREWSCTSIRAFHDLVSRLTAPLLQHRGHTERPSHRSGQQGVAFFLRWTKIRGKRSVVFFNTRVTIISRIFKHVKQTIHGSGTPIPIDLVAN